MTTPRNDPEKIICGQLNADGKTCCQNPRATCTYRRDGTHRRIAAAAPRAGGTFATTAPVVPLTEPADDAEDEAAAARHAQVRVSTQATFDDDASAATRAYNAACAAFASAQVRGAQAKTATNAAVSEHVDAVEGAQRARVAADNVRGAAEAASLPAHEADALIADIARRAANADHDVAQARAGLIKAAVREHRADTASDDAGHAVLRTRERADEAVSCARAYAENAWAHDHASQEWFDAIQDHMRETNG